MQGGIDLANAGMQAVKAKPQVIFVLGGPGSGKGTQVSPSIEIPVQRIICGPASCIVLPRMLISKQNRPLEQWHLGFFHCERVGRGVGSKPMVTAFCDQGYERGIEEAYEEGN